MAYSIEDYLNDIAGWPEVADLEVNHDVDFDLEIDRDADFERDQWLREQDGSEDNG